MFPAVFSHYFISLFSYNSYVEFAYKVFELFFFEGKKGLVYILLNLLFLETDKLLKMELEELIKYFRLGMIEQCLNDHGLEQCLKLTLL